MHLKIKSFAIIILLTFIGLIWSGCKTNKKDQENDHQHNGQGQTLYVCPMHPDQTSFNPEDTCPICGMDLEPEKKEGEADSLAFLIKPTDRYVMTNIDVVTIVEKSIPVETVLYGFIDYDTRYTGNISSNYGGRIERLYVRSKFQKISKGQKLMDVYSPELLTAQENLVFLLKNDSENLRMIQSARERLLLLGMGEKDLLQVERSHKPNFMVSIYSNYSGIITNAAAAMKNQPVSMNNAASFTTEEINLKEGMYIQKGQTLFRTLSTEKIWAVLNVYPHQQNLVKKNMMVSVVPDGYEGIKIQGKIDFIEPFFQEGSKTLTARVYLNNNYRLPIGAQIAAGVMTSTDKFFWLPEEAVLSLGINKVVFIKDGDIFKSMKVSTGEKANGLIRIIDGLGSHDQVAANAQFLMDSESFIKVNK